MRLATTNIGKPVLAMPEHLESRSWVGQALRNGEADSYFSN